MPSQHWGGVALNAAATTLYLQSDCVKKFYQMDNPKGTSPTLVEVRAVDTVLGLGGCVHPVDGQVGLLSFSLGRALHSPTLDVRKQNFALVLLP